VNVSPSADIGTATWTVTGGGDIDGQQSVTGKKSVKFTAPVVPKGQQTPCTITANFGNGKIGTITITAIPPSGIKTNKIDPTNHISGAMQLGMTMTFTLEPNTVSFYNVQTKEEGGAKPSAHGVWDTPSITDTTHPEGGWLSYKQDNTCTS